MGEDEKLLEVCKTIMKTASLIFHDTKGHLASGDLDTARADLFGIQTGIEITEELECPSETINEIKTMYKEAHRLYSDMLTSRVEALIHKTGVV